MAFLTEIKIPVKHVFFDGGQFAQIGKATRRIMVPFLYIAMKSLYWSKGKTLKRIMWCDDDKIKPYFIEAGKNLTYGNLRRQLTYIYGNFPVFEGFNHMQYQIQNSEGFARMLETIIETDRLPELAFAMWYRGK